MNLKPSAKSKQDANHIVNASLDEAGLIFNKIAAFNQKKLPYTQKNPFDFKNYVIKENNLIIAGINACLYQWGIAHVDVLFVEEHYRGKGLGSKLLKHVEQEVLTAGATIIYLDTLDFQAKDFYLKLGYEVFGVLENCPKGHSRYFLSKLL